MVVADLLSRAGLSPADGVQLVSLDRLAARPVDPAMALVVLPPIADAPSSDPLPGRHGHGDDPLALLRRLYPHDHPILGADSHGAGTLSSITIDELTACPHLLPALQPLANAASPHGLAWLVARLRAPDGCPWDREQDHLLAPAVLLEEAYEVYDTLERVPRQSSPTSWDLPLQSCCTLSMPLRPASSTSPMRSPRSWLRRRRHPHVFGDGGGRPPVGAGSASRLTSGPPA
jgi:hypothetical protein